MASMFLGIRYMSPPIFVFVLFNSFIHTLMVRSINTLFSTTPWHSTNVMYSTPTIHSLRSTSVFQPFSNAVSQPYKSVNSLSEVLMQLSISSSNTYHHFPCSKKKSTKLSIFGRNLWRVWAVVLRCGLFSPTWCTWCHWRICLSCFSFDHTWMSSQQRVWKRQWRLTSHPWGKLLLLNLLFTVGCFCINTLHNEWI